MKTFLVEPVEGEKCKLEIKNQLLQGEFDMAVVGNVCQFRGHIRCIIILKVDEKNCDL
jgi:hypothetical protein